MTTIEAHPISIRTEMNKGGSHLIAITAILMKIVTDNRATLEIIGMTIIQKDEMHTVVRTINTIAKMNMRTKAIEILMGPKMNLTMMKTNASIKLLDENAIYEPSNTSR
jgi:hypothetical protein